MSELYQNKYRSASARHPYWNYGNNAAYFVTICTKDRIHWFGEVENGEMQWSDMGKITNDCWLAIPDHFPFVRLGNHIIMPNHVHGVIIIDKPDQPRGNRFGPQSQNLASIVRGFKIGVTKNARLINPEFAWQSQYHDHIIRNQRSFDQISDYIQDNPQRWAADRFYANV